MKITMVKKMNPDGSFCKKCDEIDAKLQRAGYLQYINHIAIAEHGSPLSEGMVLAAKHNIDLAPFFIVEKEGEPPEIHTVYFRFVKQVLKPIIEN
jgi:hypothetical protein